MLKKRILITGVTASGKGALAFELAQQLDGEIISIDSMKVYRRMDIGTAKPSPEKRRSVPHHLIDVVEPSESFSVERFLDLSEKAISDIENRNKTVVAVGGTAMYIKALLYGLFQGAGTDPEIRQRLVEEIKSAGLETLHKRLAAIDPDAAQRIHPNDQKRIIRALEVYELTGKPISILQKQWDKNPKSDWLVIGIRREKQLENHRINQRVKRMIEMGWVEEVRRLLSEPLPLSPQAAAAIGYAELIDYLNGKTTLDEAIEQIKIKTRQFAKAQRTWFKTFREIKWLDVQPDDDLHTVSQRALEIISQKD